MNDATGADTLAFIEVLAGEHAGEPSVRRQGSGAPHDLLRESPAWAVESFVPVVF